MNKHKRTYLILSVILLIGTFFTLGFSNITNNGNPDLIFQPSEKGKPGFTNGVAWAVGSPRDGYGTILHTSDGGNQWVRQGTAADIPDVALEAVFTIDACNAWVVGDNAGGYGVILRTTDGGQRWTRQGDPSQIPDVGLGAVYAINTRIAWVTGNNGVILHTKDGGKTWTRQAEDTAPLVPLNGVFASDAHHVWVVGEDSDYNGTILGTILHTKNGGRTWERQTYEPNPGDYKLIWVHGLNARTAWVVGNAIVLYTNDAGETWQDKSPASGLFDFNGVFVVNRSTVWVTQDNGGIYKYDGSQWQNQKPLGYGGYYILRISAIDAQTAWTIGAAEYPDPDQPDGVILRTTTGGDTWEAYPAADMPSLNGVSFVKSGFCNPNRYKSDQ